MKDFFGNELKVGDIVIIPDGSKGKTSGFRKGVIISKIQDWWDEHRLPKAVIKIGES